MSDETNKIFQDYLAEHADDKPIDFAPLLEKHPELEGSLQNKIKAYQKVIGLFVSDNEDFSSQTLEGKTVGGCRLIKVLGQGGMGVVYLARQEKLERNVVIKVLRPFAVDNKTLKERFKRESRIIGRLNHKNIVPVYDVGEENGAFYIIMRHVKGMSLAIFIEKFITTDRSVATLREILGLEIKTTTEFLCNLIIKIADAVQYANDNGVIHRDIKPSNIIVEPDGNPVLLDFGLSHDDVEKNLTISGEFLGTPIYSAPESFQRNVANDSPQLDVYSLGVTLYELLTGALPYEGDSIYQIYLNIKANNPVRPQKRWKDIPSDLEIILLKSIFKDPDLRYKTITQFRNDLFNFLNYLPIKARRPSYVYKTRILFKKKAKLLFGIAVVFSMFSIVTYHFYAQLSTRKTELSKEKTKAALIVALNSLLTNDYGTAFNEVKKAHNLHPDSISISVWYYGLKAKLNNNFKEFEDMISRLEKQNPNDLYVRLAKSVIYHKTKNIDAETREKQYVIERLNDEQMWQSLPLYLNSLGVDEPLVLDYLNAALNKYPQNANLNFLMSVFCEKYLKNEQCHKEYLEKAATLSSRYINVLSDFYAKLPATRKDINNMITALESMKKGGVAVEPDFYKDMATLYYRLGKCDIAIDSIEKAINLDPWKSSYVDTRKEIINKCKK